MKNEILSCTSAVTPASLRFPQSVHQIVCVWFLIQSSKLLIDSVVFARSKSPTSSNSGLLNTFRAKISSLAAHLLIFYLFECGPPSAKSGFCEIIMR